MAFAVIGAAEFVLILAFVAGYQKRVSYGLVLILHGVSTLSSYRQYLDPFHLLFFAASFALYYLRDLDTKWTIGGRVPAAPGRRVILSAALVNKFLRGSLFDNYVTVRYSS